MSDVSERLWAHYTSTYCMHQQHEQCRRTCKVCASPCLCDCHGVIETSARRNVGIIGHTDVGKSTLVERITSEVYDETRYTPEARRIIDEEFKRRQQP